MNHSTDDFRLNTSGYYDPTAYKAMKKIERETEVDELHARKKKCIQSMIRIADLMGFRVQGRIALYDKKTGKTFY